MKESLNNNNPKKSKEEVPSGLDLIISLRQKNEIKNRIETLTKEDRLNTTIENLKQEIETLKERKEELSNQIYSYDADDMANLRIEYDKTDQHLAKKQKELKDISQDTEILEATIKDLEELLATRSQLN